MKRFLNKLIIVFGILVFTFGISNNCFATISDNAIRYNVTTEDGHRMEVSLCAEFEGRIRYFDAKAEDTVITIPSKAKPGQELNNLISTAVDIESVAVTEIGKGAITDRYIGNNNNIQKIIIEDGIVGIEAGAFEGLNNLTEVVIPDSVKSIEDGWYVNCPNLVVNIPDRLVKTTCGDYQEVKTLSMNATVDYDFVNTALKLLNDNREEKGLDKYNTNNELTNIAMQRAVELSVYYNNYIRPDASNSWEFGSDIVSRMEKALFYKIDENDDEETINQNLINLIQKNVIDNNYIDPQYFQIASVGIGCSRVGDFCYIYILFFEKDFSDKDYTLQGKETDNYKINIATGGEQFYSSFVGINHSSYNRIPNWINYTIKPYDDEDITVVVDDSIEPTSVLFNNINNTLSTKFTAPISNDLLSWEIEDTNIAEVDENGSIKGISIGETTLKVNLLGIEKEYKISVIDECTTVDTEEMVIDNETVSVMPIIPGIKIEDFIVPSAFPGLNKGFVVKVFDKIKQEKSNLARIGTRNVIKVYANDNDENPIASYIVAVPGDVDGDGLAKIIDSFIMLKDAIQKKQDEFDGIDMKVMDHDGNGKITMIDAFKYFSDALK